MESLNVTTNFDVTFYDIRTGNTIYRKEEPQCHDYESLITFQYYKVVLNSKKLGMLWPSHRESISLMAIFFYKAISPFFRNAVYLVN